MYVHKTWKWIGKCGDRRKGCGRKPKKGAQYLWGRGRIKELAQAQPDEQVIPESGVELPVTLVDVSQDGRVLDWVPPNCGPFNVDQANRTTGPNQRHQVVDDGLLAPTVVRKDVAQHHHVSTFGDEPVASVAPSLKTSLASVVG